MPSWGANCQQIPYTSPQQFHFPVSNLVRFLQTCHGIADPSGMIVSSGWWERTHHKNRLSLDFWGIRRAEGCVCEEKTPQVYLTLCYIIFNVRQELSSEMCLLKFYQFQYYANSYASNRCKRTWIPRIQRPASLERADNPVVYNSS